MHIKDVVQGSGFKITYIGEQTGIPRTRLSKIINGHIAPNQKEKQKLAIFFRKKDIFFAADVS